MAPVVIQACEDIIGPEDTCHATSKRPWHSQLTLCSCTDHF